MAVFVYHAKDRSSSGVRGTVLADSPRHARDQLREQGLIVQSVAEHQPASRLLDLNWLGARRARNQWGLGAHELSMLLTAGIPLLEALDTLAKQHRGAFRIAILKVRNRVEAGISLADALSEQPDIFDAASVRLVEVGENAGALDEVLAEIAEFKLQLAAFKDKISTAMMYPVFLACFGLAAAIFLMTWVLPPLLDSLQETLPVLPWPTRVAKAMSDTLLQYGWWLVAVALVFGLLARLWLRSPAGQRTWHRVLLGMPGTGNLVRKQAVSRIAMIIASLTRGGVTLPIAVNLAAKSTSNSLMRDALFQAERDMSAGEDLATSLERSRVFPPLAVRFFSVGQDSGKLEEMLQKLALDYNTQVGTAAARMTALVEPIMILILAVGVGFLLLATILPILEAGNVS